MARVVLVTGPSRGGKSSLVVDWACAREGARAFVATCPVIDQELEERVARHRRERAALGFRTVEEATRLSGVLDPGEIPEPVVVVDCLTLWVNNLLYGSPDLDEDRMAEACREVLGVCRERPGWVFLVTNEVGWGIVPGEAGTRRFRDLAGRCNQIMAAGAEVVALVVSGLPLFLKGEL